MSRACSLISRSSSATEIRLTCRLFAAALGQLAQTLREQRVILAQEAADDERAIEVARSRRAHAQPGRAGALAVGVKSRWRRRKSTLPDTEAAHQSSAAGYSSSSVACGDASAPIASAPCVLATSRKRVRDVIERDVPFDFLPFAVRLIIGLVRRSARIQAPRRRKRSLSDSQHSLMSSFSSGSTRMTRSMLDLHDQVAAQAVVRADRVAARQFPGAGRRSGRASRSARRPGTGRSCCPTVPNPPSSR